METEIMEEGTIRINQTSWREEAKEKIKIGL